jgi:serine/threonine-protein kinase
LLDTTAFLRGLFVSPDGQWIGYVENNYTLKKIPIAGGAAVSLLTADGPSRGAAWGPDNTIVFATGEVTTGLQRIPASGGPTAVLTRPDRERGEADHVNPVWLPGGRSLLFTILSSTGGLDAAKVAVLDLTTGATRTVIQGGYGARYVNGGYLVYAAAEALWATRFDARSQETRGSPVKVLPNVTVGPAGGVAHFDVADNGTLVYPRGARDYFTRTRVPVWVDRAGKETPIAAPTDAYQHPRLSPAGNRLAVVLQADIYVLDLTRPQSPSVRLTFTPGPDWFPVWTSDGRRIVFGSWRGGGFSNLYVQGVEGATAERLTESPDMQLPTSITKDGKTVVFHSFPKDLQALGIGPPHEVRTLAGSPLEERNGVISPDEHWLAYEAENPSRPGSLDVFVRTFPDVNRGTWQVTKDGGTFPAWSQNGRELYYLKPDGTMVAVSVDAGASSWKAGAPVELFRGPYLMLGDGTMGRQYDVAADGRFLMLKDAAETGAGHFVVVQNWIAEIMRLVS